MKIATWNVNSIAVRSTQVLDWLTAVRPDVLCLQEIKCLDEKFPAAEFERLGYAVETFGQRTYNGVAILSALPLADVQRGFNDDAPDAQRRLLAATVGGVRVVNVYIPNGSEVGSEKYQFKLTWLARLHRYFAEECEPGQLLALCGDFNIAPDDRDVHDPLLWRDKILCSEPERAALQSIGDWGLEDVYRRRHAAAGAFSWWDYRGGGFRRNHGLRIDHIWATAPLSEKSVDVWIDKLPRALPQPSDHAPVVAEFTV